MSKSRKPNQDAESNSRRMSWESKQFDRGGGAWSPISPLISCFGGGHVRTPTSSGSSSSGSVQGRNRSNNGNGSGNGNGNGNGNDHSGELSVSSENCPNAAVDTISLRSTPTRAPPLDSVRSTPTRDGNLVGGHRRMSSGVSISSGGGGGGGGGGNISSGSSTVGANRLPAGNICPSGKIVTTGMIPPKSPKRDVLGSGNGCYGHGSVVRGSFGGNSKSSKPSTSSSASSAPARVSSVGGGNEGMLAKALSSLDLEVVKEAGNDQYRKRNFSMALTLYNRAIEIAPNNALCRTNRAAALISLDRLMEAVLDCDEAVRLDASCLRAHERLVNLHLRLGQAEDALLHLHLFQKEPDPVLLRKLKDLDYKVRRCAGYRRIGDWESVLKEAKAAIEAGADSSPQLVACKAEALLKLQRFVEAESCLSHVPKFESYPPSCARIKSFGMLTEAYVFYVHAQVELALGRFDNAVAAAKKAGKIDPLNIEIAKIMTNAPLVKRACDRGNDLFNGNRFSEAASAYGEALKHDLSNSVLYCNRASCWFKLREWVKCADDCNRALKIQPSYTKALQLRDQSIGKLENCIEPGRDCGVLRKGSPRKNVVAEGLLRPQNLNFGGVVEQVSDLGQYMAAIPPSGISLVYFKASANEECKQMSPFVDILCIRYPSVSFLKVDVEESLEIAKVMNVRTIPTFKIYKDGREVNQIFGSTLRAVESSLMGYL